MMKFISLGVAAVILAFGAQAESPSPRGGKRAAMSNTDVVAAIIRHSRASYPGTCGCPDDVDRAGRSCGRRSAYSRPGGRFVYCYPGDVTPGMVADYRAGRFR